MIFIFCSNGIFAQQTDSTESKKLDNLRTESGVDPTRVSTRANFTFEFIDPQGPGYSFNTVLKANVGFAKWSFALKTKIRSTYQGNLGPGEMMKKGFDDLTLSIGNTVFYKGRHAINIGADFVAPIGSSDFSGQAFLFTPNFTYAITISPKFIFAINPQYSMTVVRTENVQRVSLLTVRPFFATFLPGGWFGVIEPRILQDFTNNQFDVIISPIVGKLLIKGWNLVGVAEVPVTNNNLKTTGPIYKLGIQKSF